LLCKVKDKLGMESKNSKKYILGEIFQCRVVIFEIFCFL
jgi:hypothetical protein